MTEIQREAMELVKVLPDDFLIPFIRDAQAQAAAAAEKRERAFAYWNSMRRRVPELDYDAEKLAWREEKYGDRGSD